MESIGDSAFYDCISLSSIELPENLTSIEANLFKKCTGLNSVIMGEKVKSIGSDAFSNCTNLEIIELPEQLESIGESAFSSCTSLCGIELPESLTYIETTAFYKCSSLKEIVIPEKITEIKGAVFSNCSSLSSVELPDGVESIGLNAFCDCSSLKRMELPDSIKDIKNFAWNGCDELSTIYFPKNIESVGSSLFFDTIQKIEIFTESSTVYEALGKTDLGNENVELIKPYRISYCSESGEETLIKEVYADGKQSYTVLAGDLPEISGAWYDTDYNGNGIRGDIGSKITNICDDITFQNLPVIILKQPEGIEVDYGFAESPEVFIEVATVEDVNVSYQWQEAIVTDGIRGNYENIAGAESSSYVIPTGKCVGTYELRCMLTFNENVIYSEGATLSVNQLQPIFEQNPTITGVYGQKLTEMNLSGDSISKNGVSGIWKLDITEAEETEILNVNTDKLYNVVFLPEDTENYSTYCTTVVPEIKPREITVTAENKTKVYGEENPAFTFMYNEEDLVENDTMEDLSVILTTVADMESGVGTYEITGESASKNYKVTIVPGILTITQEETTITIEEGKEYYKKTYGDEVFELEGIQVLGSGTLVYKVSEGKDYAGASKAVEEILSVSEQGVVSIHGSGSAVITLSIVASDNHKLSKEKQIVVEVERKAVTAKADDKTRVYREENPQFTFTYNEADLVGNDTVEDLAVTLTTKADVNSDVGSYEITGKSESSNYYVEITPGNLTITQAEAEIIVLEGKEHYQKCFGDEDFQLEGIQTTGEGTLLYTLMEGKDVEGQEKAAEEIVSVSAEGIVTILGSGSVVIKVDMESNKNFVKPESKQIIVEIARRDGINVTVEEKGELIYTGHSHTPAVVVYDGTIEKKLEEGTDYTITYKNTGAAYTYKEGEAGFDAREAPQIVIKGKGNYSQTLIVYYTIQPKNIADEDVLVDDIVVEYNGELQIKNPLVIYNQKKLQGVRKLLPEYKIKVLKDYICSYPEWEAEGRKGPAFKEVGTYEIVLEGTGNFTGTRKVNLIITEKGMSINKATVKGIPNQTYNGGKEIELGVQDLQVTTKVSGEKRTLIRDVDYNVRYENNTEIGTATVIITGIGEYVGTKKVTFEILGTSLSKAKVTGIQNKVYNGEEQSQQVMLTLTTKNAAGEKEEITLVEGEHFEVSYINNVNVGTAKVIIKGIGAYTGTIKKNFKITVYDFTGETDAEGTRKENSLLTEANGLLEKADGELSVKYTKGGCEPKVQLFFHGTELTVGKDYTISYSNNKTVTTEKLVKQNKVPTIIIKGKGKFKGTIKKTFTIVTKNLNDNELPVTIKVVDKGESLKAGGYISKPVITDVNGLKLKEGVDYTKPVYSTVDAEGNKVILTNKSKITAGNIVTVSVDGKGAYTGENLSASYRITEKGFGNVKVMSIKKYYMGKEVKLTEEDFVYTEGKDKGKSKVTLGSGKNKAELVYGKDFEIVENSYKNNIKKGTASVTLRGIGEYGGESTINFKIQAREMYWWQH